MPTAIRPKWHIMALDSSTVNLSGQQIKQERRRRGLTQQQLADAAGVSLRTIGRIERGEIEDPRSLELVAAELGQIGTGDDPDAKILRDASMYDLLQRAMALYAEAIQTATPTGSVYEPGSPDLDEEGLIARPTTRTDKLRDTPDDHRS